MLLIDSKTTERRRGPETPTPLFSHGSLPRKLASINEADDEEQTSNHSQAPPDIPPETGSPRLLYNLDTGKVLCKIPIPVHVHFIFSG